MPRFENFAMFLPRFGFLPRFYGWVRSVGSVGLVGTLIKNFSLTGQKTNFPKGQNFLE
jgi:hypothetical protein